MKRLRKLCVVTLSLATFTGITVAPTIAHAVVDKSVLPSDFEDVAKALFAQGLADPTGGEYREVIVEVGFALGMPSVPAKTHGWVMPVDKDGKKQVVCWNGLSYVPLTVGEKADLDKDIRELLDVKSLTQEAWTKGAHAPDEFDSFYLGLNRGWEASSLKRVTANHAMLAVLLWRLGRKELAAQVYTAQGVTYAPNAGTRSVYGELAQEWTWRLTTRALSARMRGDDALAYKDFAFLTEVQPQLLAGIQRYEKIPTSFTRFPLLARLPELLEDTKRRLGQPVPVSFSSDAFRKLPQTERIKLLIAQLDQVSSVPFGQPYGIQRRDFELSNAFSREGTAAVPALLDALDTDTRLARFAELPTHGFLHGYELYSARDAARDTLQQILRTKNFGGKSIRAWWEENKGRGREDRWLATLSNDSAGWSAWNEATNQLLVRIPEPTDRTKRTLQGESLRGSMEPSVSDVLRRRVFDYKTGQSNHSQTHSLAVGFAVDLYVWEKDKTVALETLQTLQKDVIAYYQQNPKAISQDNAAQQIAKLTIARALSGDKNAASEYEAWLKSVSPEILDSDTESGLAPLWWLRDNPEFQRIAESLFKEGSDVAPTVWSRLLADIHVHSNHSNERMAGGPLLAVPAFRKLMIRRLIDKTPAGIAWRESPTSGVSILWQELLDEKDRPEPPKGVETKTLRICDRFALQMQRLPGVPKFNSEWSESERDRACSAIIDYVKKNEANFATKNDEYTLRRGDNMGFNQLVVLPAK